MSKDPENTPKHQTANKEQSFTEMVREIHSRNRSETSLNTPQSISKNHSSTSIITCAAKLKAVPNKWTTHTHKTEFKAALTDRQTAPHNHNLHTSKENDLDKSERDQLGCWLRRCDSEEMNSTKEDSPRVSTFTDFTHRLGNG